MVVWKQHRSNICPLCCISATRLGTYRTATVVNVYRLALVLFTWIRTLLCGQSSLSRVVPANQPYVYMAGR